MSRMVVICSLLVGLAGAGAVPAWAGHSTDGRSLHAGAKAGTVLVHRDGDPTSADRRIPEPEGCTYRAVGGGQLLSECRTGGPAARPRLYDLASSTFHDPAGLDALVAEENDNLANGEFYESDDVGAHALSIYVTGNHVEGDDWYDWTSGRPAREGSSAHGVASLDGPGGVLPLCAPLRLQRRVAHDDFLDDPYTTYDNASLVAGRLLRWWGRTVRLARCGSSHEVVLTRHLIGVPLLTGRYAAWFGPKRLHVHLLASGRELTYPYDPQTLRDIDPMEGTDATLQLVGAAGPIRVPRR